jgi:hypothetical protein
MTRPAPFIPNGIISETSRPGITRSDISQCRSEHEARYHVSEGTDGNHRRPPLRDSIARVVADAGPDEASFLAQLRAVVAGVETPADRLLAKYRGRPSGRASSSLPIVWSAARRLM